MRMIHTIKDDKPFVDDNIQKGIDNRNGFHIIHSMLCGIALLVCSLILDPIQRTERPLVGKGDGS